MGLRSDVLGATLAMHICIWLMINLSQPATSLWLLKWPHEQCASNSVVDDTLSFHLDSRFDKHEFTRDAWALWKSWDSGCIRCIEMPLAYRRSTLLYVEIDLHPSAHIPWSEEHSSLFPPSLLNLSIYPEESHCSILARRCSQWLYGCRFRSAPFANSKSITVL